MRIKYIFGTLLCACIAFTGCSDDVFEEHNEPWNEGDGIIFGARAGYESNADKSRTQYTGEHYNYEGKDFERIEWVPKGNGKLGDHISIYCPQARIANPGKDFFVDYVVTAHKSGQDATGQNSTDFATLAPASKSTLQWGTPDEHFFYACYPTKASTAQIDKESKKERSAITLSKIPNNPNGVHFEGRVPANQIPKQITSTQGTGAKVYVAEPYMENAHMVAVNNALKLSGKPVDLTFKSIVTVLELHLTGNKNQSTVVTGVMIGSANPKQRVAGKYECDITSGPDYPKCTVVGTSDAGNQVMIPLLQKDAQGNVRGIMLNPGETLKLTAFLLPTTDLEDLVLTVITPAGRQSHAIVNGQGTAGKITFTAHKKHYLKNIQLPSSFHSADWMSRIDNNVYLHQLSIPGSGSSFSYSYPTVDASGNPVTDWQYYQTQTLDIQQQWDKGIRCFEIVSDRGHWDGNSIFKPSSTLEGQPVIGAKNADLSVTVDQAVEQIYQLVQAHPTEFAMIVMTYQPERSRDGGKYINTFDTFYSETFLKGKAEADVVAKYNPNETLGNVRGKVMFFLRPTSDGEDMLGKTTLQGNSYSSKNYIIIDGWGSLQDKWKQRGYPTTDTNPNDGFNGNSAKDDLPGSIENGIVREGLGITGLTCPSATDFVLKGKGTRDFKYNTNVSNLNIWAQEWNRVIPGKTNHINYKKVYYDAKVYWVAWKESYSEKLDDAKDTFDRTCAKTENIQLYFNCLTGYLSNLKEDDYYTYTPAYVTTIKKYNGSSHGNVVEFSDKINKDFFEFLWGKWSARETGPLGVVMMNRICSGTAETNPGNFYMPTTVISNNFSFPLESAK